MILSETILAVIEGGDTTYTIRLNSEPSATVIIDVTKNAPDSTLTVDPIQVTFSSLDWFVAQTITLSAPTDSVVENSVSYQISHSSSASSDAAYASGTSFFQGNQIDVIVHDNDFSYVKISTNAVQVVEGLTTMYTITLGSEPSDAVTIDLDNGDNQGVVTLSHSQLIIPAANWATVYTITVTATDDTSHTANFAYNVLHTISSNDAAYNTQSIFLNAVDTVQISYVDNNVASIHLTQSVLQLSEAGPTDATYNIVLTSEPSHSVVVTFTRTTARATFTPSSPLTFAIYDWSVASRILLDHTYSCIYGYGL